jgi:YD repeat-containing protein
MTYSADGTFTLRQKDGTVFHFALIPDTPFRFQGRPVYRLTTIVDRNDNTTALFYANGHLTQITDTYERHLTLVYYTRDKLAAITDPLGRATSLAYDPTGSQLLTITDPHGGSIQYRYNGLHQLTDKVDREGASVRSSRSTHAMSRVSVWPSSVVLVTQTVYFIATFLLAEPAHATG